MTEFAFWEGVATGIGVASVAVAFGWWLLRYRSEAPDRGSELPPVASIATRPSPVIGHERSDGIGLPPGSLSQPATTPVLQLTPQTGRVEEPTLRLRLSQRILLHIARQGHLGPDDVAPRGMSQAGMVEALDVGQGTLTGALRALVDAGLLSEKREHARGVERRVKIYRLTSSGEALAKELRSRRPTAHAAVNGMTPLDRDAGAVRVRL